VAESGVAAHWLYKASDPKGEGSHTSMQWVQSLLDIQHESRDAADFWDHIKIDLFPDSVYVFTPKGKIIALPRGATVVDFAYAIHSDVGDSTVAATRNGDTVPLRAEVHNGDVVEVITSPSSAPNPAWLSFVQTGRARASIRGHLKTMASSEARRLGEKMLRQALRAEGVAQVPPVDDASHELWDKVLRFAGNKTTEDLLADLGLGKRIASMVAKKIAALLVETGHAPDMLLLTRARFASETPIEDQLSQGVLTLDGSEGSSVHYAPCCTPIPGDRIVGYLGRGEGLMVHTEECPNIRRLLERDRERFLPVEWSDEPNRTFDCKLHVVLQQHKQSLGRVASALNHAEVDITHVEMGADRDQMELQLTVAVRDRVHLAGVMRGLRRTHQVLRVQRGRGRG
jgi:guanosine-3',5'-bis(diphosphate) 3'-pyrophosphohydrolase